jgi:hypothetical protein
MKQGPELGLGLRLGCKTKVMSRTRVKTGKEPRLELGLDFCLNILKSF